MASRWGGSQRGPLLTISVGKTGCSSVGDFLRVILKASGPLPLLQPLWPLFLLLQLPSKGDPLCVLRSVVLGGRLGDGGGWLEVIAGICEQGEHLSQLDSIILLSSSCQQWTETRRVDWSGQSAGHSRSLEWEAAQGANKGGRAKRKIGRAGHAQR